MRNAAAFADPDRFARACEAVRAMHAHGMSLSAIASWCQMSHRHLSVYRAILDGTAEAISDHNADRILDGYDRFRAAPPVIAKQGGARRPTDAQRDTFSRMLNANKKRPKPRPEQAPVTIPAEFHHPSPDPVPQPLTPPSRLREKLLARREAERKGAQAA